MRERKQFSKFGNETLLSVSEYYGVKPTRDIVKSGFYETRANSLEGYRIVRRGDFVMNYMLAWKGAYGVSYHDGIVSPAYAVFRIDQRLAQPHFIHLLLRTERMQTVFRAHSKGIIDSRLRLYPNMFLAMRTDLPDHTTQRNIIQFLDREISRIDQLIEKKQRFVELLDEKRSTLMGEAVTGQMDVQTFRPYPTYKNTLMEWIPTIPSHWNEGKLKSQFGMQGSGTTPSPDYLGHGAIPWVMSGDLDDDTVNATRKTVSRVALRDFSALKMFPKGSLVIAMYGATIGKTGILSSSACTNQACCVLADPKHEASSRFFQAVVVSARNHLIQQGSGGGQPNINAKIVCNLRVPMPPHNEQLNIVTYLNREFSRIRDLECKTQTSIALLLEFRSSLITAAVTGQIDVDTWQNGGETDRRLEQVIRTDSV